jgi:transposase
MMKTWVGVDVSKATLDVCWFKEGAPIHLKVANDMRGLKELATRLPQDSQVVMEATGAYYLRLAHFLLMRGTPLSVVNPLSIKRYAQMKLARAKTDKYDAALIAGYGASQEPALWSLPDSRILEMQQMVTLEEQLTVQRRALLNQDEAFSQSPFASKQAQRSIKALVKALDRELQRIEADLEALSLAHYPRIVEILCSIPGMGIKTAQALIVATRGFHEKTNGRNLCSYVGIAPRPHQSGTSVRGRGRISKMGSRGVRCKIYMCTLSAIRSNAACKVFYERLRKNGKPAKVALIAVAAKLLRQAAAMIKADELFDEKLAMGS